MILTHGMSDRPDMHVQSGSLTRVVARFRNIGGDDRSFSDEKVVIYFGETIIYTIDYMRRRRIF